MAEQTSLADVKVVEEIEQVLTSHKKELDEHMKGHRGKQEDYQVGYDTVEEVLTADRRLEIFTKQNQTKLEFRHNPLDGSSAVSNKGN